MVDDSTGLDIDVVAAHTVSQSGSFRQLFVEVYGRWGPSNKDLSIGGFGTRIEPEKELLTTVQVVQRYSTDFFSWRSPGLSLGYFILVILLSFLIVITSEVIGEVVFSLDGTFEPA